MEFKTTAVKGEKSYKHFGVHELTANMYGVDADDIEQLTMVVSDNQERPDADYKPEKADYWGWVTDEGELSMVYPQFFLLNMCFPYGIKASEDAGHGKAYRLEIKK